MDQFHQFLSGKEAYLDISCPDRGLRLELHRLADQNGLVSKSWLNKWEPYNTIIFIKCNESDLGFGWCNKVYLYPDGWERWGTNYSGDSCKLVCKTCRSLTYCDSIDELSEKRVSRVGDNNRISFGKTLSDLMNKPCSEKFKTINQLNGAIDRKRRRARKEVRGEN
jgi:hypothetical protein